MTAHIGTPEVGDGTPINGYSEIRLNRNGRVATAIQLIDVAADTGATRISSRVARRLRQ
jgi:sialic acid synthase SpsE